MTKFLKKNLLPVIRGDELESYVLKHAEKHSKKTIYQVTKPLYVFKAALSPLVNWDRSPCIVNLIIPVGALISIDAGAFRSSPLTRCEDDKVRASEAYVHSVVGLRGKSYDGAVSDYDRLFAYIPGTTVVPSRFSTSSNRCTGGIHFFFNLSDAWNYLG